MSLFGLSELVERPFKNGLIYQIVRLYCLDLTENCAFLFLNMYTLYQKMLEQS